MLACLTLPLVACGGDESPPPDLVPAGEPFALVHGTLIDGTGAAPLADAVLVIRQGLVVAAGPSAEVEIPAGVRVVDLDGATILPGFINAHVHGGYDQERLRAWAHAGVTTVRDLGADPRRPLFAIRDSLRRDPRCAWLVAAGPIMTVPGGYPMVPWSSSSGLPVNGAADAREKAERLLDDGADLIKIAVESGSDFGRSIPVLSPAETRAIVETAHARGARVSAHVLVAEDLTRALDRGADDIAHMIVDALPGAATQRMVRDGIYWVPTLELWHGVGHGPGEAAVSNLRRYVEAGGKVALGTDYGGYDSEFDLGMPVREVAWMAQAGMTPMAIFVAATRDAARACGLGDSLGTVQAGRIADLLVVRGDPLRDLGVLQDVELVVRRGVMIRAG